jgi:3-hydroxyisobutyrate dehydrogenase-like beta-hydroxyacid dehydrogenase
VLRQAGIATAESIASLVAESDVILSCLANDSAVESVYFDSGGVFSVATPGAIILEMSTVSPALSRSLHLQAASKGVRLLDLAISGSTPAVDAGTVTLLAGGDQSTFEECTPIYESIARQWFLIGPGSSGVRMKLVVNLLLGVGMQALAEAVSLGEHLLIDRNVLLDVLSKTTVIPPALTGKIQKIRDLDYSPEFPLRLMSKDMDLVVEAAERSDVVLPAAAVVQFVLAACLADHGDLDLAVLARAVEGHMTRV